MKKFGFTLAEIVITVSIIGITAALFAPAVGNAIPDTNKVKVLKYYNIINNAVIDIFNENDIDSITDGKQELKNKIDIDSNNNGPENTTWSFTETNDDGYIVTIDLDKSKQGCSYSSTCAPRNVDTFLFIIERSGQMLPGDALTEAYMKNPLKMNDKKTDLQTASTFLSKYEKEETQE